MKLCVGGQQQVASVHQEAQALDQGRAAVFKEEQSELQSRALAVTERYRSGICSGRMSPLGF